MIKVKKTVILLTIVDIVVISAIFAYWFLFCTQSFCTYQFKNAFLEPFLAYILGLLFVFIILLKISERDFRNWLKYIASWYLPLSVVFVSQISIYSSFILAIDRTQAVLWWMGGLFLMTVVYVIVQKYILKKV